MVEKVTFLFEGMAADRYDVLRERSRKRNASISLTGRDIAPLSEVLNPARRAEGLASFQRFCELYFPAAFHLAWSKDHLRILSRIEQAVRHGGLFAMAMPRGSGKTTITERAAIWGLLTGELRFVALIAGTEGKARELLAAIKTELQSNDRLAEDFPEICFPIRRLEGDSRRCTGQLFDGRPTRITWTKTQVILPDILGSAAAGSIISVCGLTGNVRGQKHVLPSGDVVRPELVLIDDPQTRESAMSASQSAQREALIAGDVLGMAGPDKKIAAVMPCTVIRKGDMADTLLNRDRHPEWQGERAKMIYAWPKDEKSWLQYGEIRAQDLRNGGDGSRATAFYAENREAMDAGAVVAWPERHNSDELSGLQCAMNLRLRDEGSFFSEYQNDPLIEGAELDMLTREQLVAKTGSLSRGQVPTEGQWLTAAIDLHDQVLFYTVVAWGADFTGQVVDYGTHPEQGRSYFALRGAMNTLAREYPDLGREAAVAAGLERLALHLLDQEFQREDGQVMQIERLLVDAGYLPDVCFGFCRHSGRGSVVMPSRGRGIGPTHAPMSQWKRKPGDLTGFHWYAQRSKGTRELRHIVVDTNFWKSFLQARLAVAKGDAGCLTLFEARPDQHRLFADHLLSEQSTRVEANGRTVDVWALPPARPDNHWLDCLVGCAVGASMQGAHLVGAGERPPATNVTPGRRRRRPRNQRVQYMFSK